MLSVSLLKNRNETLARVARVSAPLMHKANQSIDTDRSHVLFAAFWPLETYVRTVLGFFLLRRMIDLWERLELLRSSSLRQVQFEELMSLASFLVDAEDRGTFEREIEGALVTSQMSVVRRQKIRAMIARNVNKQQALHKDVFKMQLADLVEFVDKLGREQDDKLASKLIQHIQQRANVGEDEAKAPSASLWARIASWSQQQQQKQQNQQQQSGGSDTELYVAYVDDVSDNESEFMRARAAWLVFMIWVMVYMTILPETYNTAKYAGKAVRRITERREKAQRLLDLRAALWNIRSASDVDSLSETATYQVVAKGAPGRVFVRRVYMDSSVQNPLALLWLDSYASSGGSPQFEIECGKPPATGALFRVTNIQRSPFDSGGGGGAIIGADVRPVPPMPMFTKDDHQTTLVTLVENKDVGEVYVETGKGRLFRVDWSDTGPSSPVSSKNRKIVRVVPQVNGDVELDNGYVFRNPEYRERTELRLVSEGFLERRERLKHLISDPRAGLGQFQSLVNQTAAQERNVRSDVAEALSLLPKVITGDKDKSRFYDEVKLNVVA